MGASFWPAFAGGGIGHADAQFGQLSLDALAPQVGLLDHICRIRPMSSRLGKGVRPVIGIPAPEKAEAQAMPPDNSAGLNHHKPPWPPRPTALEQHPQQTIGIPEFGLGDGTI